MFPPTPYRWTTGGGITHVFYDNHTPPTGGFGWSSLCGAVRLPIEGEHFELNQDATEEIIPCRQCRKRLGGSSVDFDDEPIAVVDGCLVRLRINEEGVITQAERVCHGTLHHSLLFEPDSFSGNLAEQAEDVCSECWETYVDHQWSGRDEGADLCVKVYADDNRSEYFAASAETSQGGREARLQLVSKNGLKKDIPRGEIESITLTPFRQIDY